MGPDTGASQQQDASPVHGLFAAHMRTLSASGTCRSRQGGFVPMAVKKVCSAACCLRDIRRIIFGSYAIFALQLLVSEQAKRAAEKKFRVFWLESQKAIYDRGLRCSELIRQGAVGERVGFVRSSKEIFSQV